MPALAMHPSPQSSPVSRLGRAQAMCRLPDTVLQSLACTQPLSDALLPFLPGLNVDATCAFDIVAFLHAFGMCGPRKQHWNTLFESCGSLRPEDMAVLVAFVACGSDGCDRDLMNDVVFGSRDVPCMLDKVCSLWDEWLLSDSCLTELTTHKVAQLAELWSLEKTPHGFVWMCEEEGDDGVYSRQALGDAVHICGNRIVNRVLPSVIHDIYSRLSISAQQQQTADSYAATIDTIVRVVLRLAESILVNRVYECMATVPTADV